MTKQSETPKHDNLSRRKLLKVIAATSGAVVASQMMPTKWAKPVIEAGVLPAHAQGSPGNVINTSFQVILTWNDGVNLDLRVREPNGSEAVRGNSTTTLSHSGDDFPNLGGSGREEVTNRTALADGSYAVFVDWIAVASSDVSAAVEPDPQPSLTIITHAETVVISPVPISSSNNQVHAANVNFDSGSITRLV